MTCQEFDNIIADYVEGEITAEQKIEVETHLKECSKCQTTFNYYQEIVEKLHTLPQEKCPDTVIEKVFHSVRVDDSKPSFLTNIYNTILERHSWKISFALAVIILGIFVIYPHLEYQEPVQQQYTAQEVEKAKKDVELALAYFHYFTTKTEQIMETQIIQNYLIKPIRTAFKPILNGG